MCGEEDWGNGALSDMVRNDSEGQGTAFEPYLELSHRYSTFDQVSVWNLKRAISASLRLHKASASCGE